jgi:hypothetical protein
VKSLDCALDNLLGSRSGWMPVTETSRWLPETTLLRFQDVPQSAEPRNLRRFTEATPEDKLVSRDVRRSRLMLERLTP